MREALRALFILALLSPPLYAQPSTVGIKVGLSMSTLDPGSTDYVFKTGYRADFTAGAFANLPLNRHFALQPEVALSRKGTTIGENRADQQFVRTNYVELPVLLDYRFLFAGSRTNSGRILAGPTLGIKLSEQAWRVTYDLLDRKRVEDVEGNFFRPFDLGLSLGTGAIFRSGRTTLSLDVRFTQGVIDSSTGEGYLDAISGNDGIATKSGSRNQVFSFTLGLGLAPAPSTTAGHVVQSDRDRLPHDAKARPRPTPSHQACYTQYVVVYALRTLGRKSSQGYIISPVSEWGGVDNNPRECPLPPISGKAWEDLRADYLKTLALNGWNRIRTVLYATREEAEAMRRHYIDNGMDGIDAYLGECAPLSPLPSDR